ncbi:hypothetical protein Trydic_g20888 [Trypoxylus dichotomus]
MPGTDDEIPENTKEEQSKKNEGRNKTARPQEQEEFKHKVAPIIIKETAKWTKTSNVMKRMKSETEKRPAKEDTVNRSDESEEKLALILGCMVLNFNSANATTVQRLAFLQQTEELPKLYKTK